jgi:hypothetical protein
VEKHAVKVGLTSRKTDQPRSKAPTARRAPCQLGCAARCAHATAPPWRPCWPGSHRLEARAVGPLRACHPWSPSRIFEPRRTHSELSRGPSPVPSARKSAPVAVPQHLSRASHHCALPIKAAHRPAPRKPQRLAACQCTLSGSRPFRPIPPQANPYP